jgi:transposase InsO family protein
MDEEKKKEIALFRFGVIAPVLHGTAGIQIQFFRRMAEKVHYVPYCGNKKYKPETFKGWLKSYRKGGFDSLLPKTRSDKGEPRKIDEQLQESIKDIFARFSSLSGSAAYRILISEGKIKVGDITEGTLRKFIKDNGLKQNPVVKARKKFEKQHINELWIADCMHGPYLNFEEQARKRKVFLIAAIDDHSRVICAWGWFINENSISLEIVLKEGFARFGTPKVLYCDNGSIFITSNLQIACARLGIALIHSKPYDSPSRGKIERFFRTVRQKFLSVLNTDEIRDLPQLNHQFEQWLEKEYHKHPHHGIDGQRPMDRFMEDSKQKPIRRISKEELDIAFQITLYRTVKNDSTISVNGVLYECPPRFIGQKIEVRCPSDKPGELTLYQDDQPLMRLKKNNPVENANPPAWTIDFARAGTKK